MRLIHFRAVRRLIAIGAILTMPAVGYAQTEASISGTITDATGGVLPGVTITATHEASGNTFVGVSDERGVFRLLVRTGAFRLTVELTGFATLNRRIELLVGQNAVVNLQLAPSTVQESVTVTGEAPLIETTSSTLGGNIDPRQMQELPINGRNWMDLAMLAPGSRQNQSSGVPLLRQGYSQIQVDGQQITNNYIGIGDDQARFSRDSIAEFEVITNRFDATQGRSAGMIANAVTKSGTNTPAGTLSAYFRDDKFNAADKVQHVVLPYSNQQISGTFGGPIVKDRVHLFGNYEYEREPQVLVYSATGPLSVFNINIPAPRRQYEWGVKGDVQFSPKLHLAVRGNGYEQNFYMQPATGGAVNHPSTAQSHQRFTKQTLGTLTMVLSNRMLNVVKAGYSNFNRNNDPLTKWAGGKNQYMTSLRDGAPIRVSLRGYAIGNVVQHHNQDLGSVRDDLTISYRAAGRHDLKTGGEYIYNIANLIGCASLCSPRIIAQNGAATSINLQAAFPVWNDASTWNLNLLGPVAQRYEASFTNLPGFFRNITQHNLGFWVQDDWTLSPRLTLNLGVRYDFQNHIGAELNLPPFLPGAHPNDTNNIAPRLGFAYSLNDRTVIRGGYGTFYAQGTADEAHQTILYIIGASPLTPYDGRADWPTNPFGGAAPSFDQVLANACDLNGGRAGCQVRQFIPEINSPFWAMPYSHQGSIGFERQVGSAISVQSNFVYTGGKNEEYSQNINLTYNSATGANYPSSDATRRAIPQFGPIQMSLYEGRSNYYGWENSITRRMSNRWQASLTYTLSRFKDSNGDPYRWSVDNGHLTRARLGFKVAPDLGSEYVLAATDQRHRAVFNGIWQGPYDIQLSGVYFYGSGLRFVSTYNGDLRDQAAGGESRLRPNGTVVPRNSLVGSPIHRVDLRLQKRLRLAGRASVDGLVEVFNLFNHANYGSYTTTESSQSYGQPTFNNNVSYGPRALQLGFKAAF